MFEFLEAKHSSGELRHPTAALIIFVLHMSTNNIQLAHERFV